MQFFYGYIYYRIIELNFNNKGKADNIAVSIISISQSFLLLAVLNPISSIFFSKSFFENHSKQFGWVGALICLCLLAVNYKIFNGKYNEYRRLWKNESKEKKIAKDILGLIVLIIPFTLFYFF